MKAVALTSLLCASALSLTAAVTESIRQVYPVSPKATLDLENINGSIKVVVGSQEEIIVEAEKKGSDEDDLKRINVKITPSSDAVVIRTEIKKKTFNWGSGASVNYRITVPASLAKTKASSVNGSVHTDAVPGKQTLETVNGRIEARETTGDVSLETVNGSLTLVVKALPSHGSISTESVNGSCEVSLPATTSAKLNAENVNGSIRCELPLVDSVSERHSLKGKLGDGAGTITLETVNGSLSVKKSG